MIRRLIVVVAWLLVGHAALGGLYLGLLQVPESTAWMLALSAAIALALVVGALWVQAGALVLWSGTRTLVPAVAAGLRRASALLPAVLLFAAAWYLGAHLRS